MRHVFSKVLSESFLFISGLVRASQTSVNSTILAKAITKKTWNNHFCNMFVIVLTMQKLDI